jgi:hypothetical protein
VFFYHPDVLRKIEAGEIPDRPDATPRGGGDLTPYITELIAEHGPATPAMILEWLKQIPAAVARLERNPQAGYATLSRMLEDGELERENRVYRLSSGEGSE